MPSSQLCQQELLGFSSQAPSPPFYSAGRFHRVQHHPGCRRQHRRLPAGQYRYVNHVYHDGGCCGTAVRSSWCPLCCRSSLIAQRGNAAACAVCCQGPRAPSYYQATLPPPASHRLPLSHPPNRRWARLCWLRAQFKLALLPGSAPRCCTCTASQGRPGGRPPNLCKWRRPCDPTKRELRTSERARCEYQQTTDASNTCQRELLQHSEPCNSCGEIIPKLEMKR